MDKDFEFFREAIMAIIGELDFGNSLMASFQILRRRFPLEAITIDQYLPERGGINTLCVITDSGVSNGPIFVPLDTYANQYMKTRRHSRTIINIAAPSQSPVAQAHSQTLSSFFPLKPRGYLVGYLTLGNQWLGDLVFVGNRINCFTKRHEHLLSMLLAPFSLTINSRLHLKSIMASKKQTDEERDRLRREIRQLSDMTLIGEERGLKSVMDDIHQLDGRDIPVLILGETGTGKELVANAIQRFSRRSKARFIRVNCGALPESLLDSELFGYEKGSFTGAETLKTGRFEQADGGTLFLDEVGELSPSAQVRLLRVLQDGIVERIGSETPTPVDVRIIAATNRNLDLMRKQGTFREDLFHRLNVFPIRIPPLRERTEDIPLLVEHVVKREATRMEISPPSILKGALERAKRYAWPGNVRELQNIVERALILNPSGPLDIGQYLLPSPQEEHSIPTPSPHDQKDHSLSSHPQMDEKFVRRIVDEQVAAALERLREPAISTLDQAMSAHILKALEVCRGKISGPNGAAALLGLNHSTLRNKMKKLEIYIEDHRMASLSESGKEDDVGRRMK